MKKEMLKIISACILGVSLLCGCGSTNEKVGAEKQASSQSEEQEVKEKVANEAREQQDKQIEEQRRQEAQKQQQTAAQAQNQQATTINNSQQNGETVYVASSGKGKCYHKNSNCSKMKGKVQSLSRSQAEQQGFKPCSKCYR